MGTLNETIYYVKENGTGFDESYAEKLCSVFQRLHKATEYEGTGIGPLYSASSTGMGAESGPKEK